MKKQSLQSSSSSKTCNQSLWKFIAKAPGRFKIIKQCVTVTGTVLSINREPDGDTDFPLALDPQYKNMVTKANFNPLMQGGIWCEMICRHPEISSEMNLLQEVNVMDLMDD
jgi:hypothetical protein